MKIPYWKDWPHVLEMQQFRPQDLMAIIHHASVFEEALHRDEPLPRLSRKRRRANGGKKRRRVRTLFYEASTRTATTFLDALHELECSAHDVQDPGEFSSAAKGESRRAGVASYITDGDIRGCDGVIIRDKEEGASHNAADVVETILGMKFKQRPLFVINGGDGKGQHPTQALVDLTTISRHRIGHEHFLDDLTVLFPGELDKSRVVNSLLYAFGKFSGHRIRVKFCCPRGMGPKMDLLEYLTRHQVPYEFVVERDFAKAIEGVDIVYMTRVQRERKQPGKRSIKINRDAYVFRAEYLPRLKKGAFIMHPLPINEDPDDPPSEIDPELSPLALCGDPRCVWLKQSHRGLPVRAALLDLIFAGLDAQQK